MNIILMAPGGEGGGLSQIIMIVLIVVVFYFFMIRPQAKKQKEEKKFRESIQKGDKIVTVGGIHGKIAETGEQTVTIDVGSGVKMKVNRSAISMNYTQGGEAGESELAEKK